LQVEHAGLVAQHDALGDAAGPAQGDGEPPVAREIAALRDRADQWRVETMRTYRRPACSRPLIGSRLTW
jgi:hypothetical protein